ncbi:MAG: hypothetical protein JSV21_11405 [Nitrospirota bacterium]|nr:MAG: hypothetical protein JSV21_11405 [Nitrospirota bacterium]
MKPYLIRTCLILISLLVLVSCGGDMLGNDNVVAPPDGSLTFLSESITYSGYTIFTDGLVFRNQVFVAVQDKNGIFIPNALVSIQYFNASFYKDLSTCTWDASAALIDPTYTGNLLALQPMIQFFNDDGNPANAPVTIKTGEDGIARLTMDVYLGCGTHGPVGLGFTHSGTINAWSGSLVAEPIDLSVS